jgi:BirA family biotin operon repressor/biotin-[acetyl-CoA-carboxylase] ligase
MSLHHFASVGSTNDEAKTLARAGAPSGTVVWADEQTAGRGRRGRVWRSPPGNLYLSLIARPDCAPAQAAQLGFAAALALGDAIAGLGLSPSYKWPNDVLLNGRKLAGILLESEMTAGGGLDFVVIGVGVNVAIAPGGIEYPATSLAAACVATTPADLLAAFTRHFANWQQRWREEGFAPLRTAWLAAASGLGDEILVRLARQTLCGRFLDLDADGALLLGAAGGHRRIAAGEVFPIAAASAPRLLRDAPFGRSSG